MQKIQRHFTILILLACTWLGLWPASAQYNANFQTNTISGVTNNWLGNYLVGSNTFADSLIIRSAGVLTTYDGFVGYQPESSSNLVSVSGAGSVWSNMNLYVGEYGSANTMVISNAGRVVSSGLGSVAHQSSSSSNIVIVTGTNSAWNMTDTLLMGDGGSGNRLIVTNGGRVLNTLGTMGDEMTGSGNFALVTSPGSSWSNTSVLTIGRTAGDNRVVVNNGARLYSFYAYLGVFDSAPSNSVLVTGTNSVWDDSGETSTMNIGMRSSGNSIVVMNGGKILGYFVYLARFGGTDNSVLVTGPGSTYSLNCHFYVGNQGTNNWYTAANGATIHDKFCYISYEANSSSNSVLLTGTNTYWSNDYSVFVGFSGDAASLTLSNGPTMTCVEHVVMGYDTNSSDNRALITGGGTVLNPAMNVYVGSEGPINSMVISNGATVRDNYGAMGLYLESVSNSVMVTGTGSLWTNNNNMYVGHSSIGNSLVITNGGKVFADRGYMGFDGDGHFNSTLVTGTGSVWSNRYATLVGNFGSENTLTISNGGLVSDFWGILGEEDYSTNNTVYVEPGGTWRTGRLRVGDYGSHNALYVNGGKVFAGTTMDVGYDPIYPNNLCQLNSGEINVTNAAQNAVLEVYGGSLVLMGGILRVDTLIVTNINAQFMGIGGTLSYRSLQLTPGYDADVDGIPNSWEQARGLNPLNPLDAFEDPDGDGMSNLEEFLAGTNPTNALSRLIISAVTMTNGHARVNWQAVGGKSYVVQTSTNVVTGFTDVSPVITIPGSAETTTNYLDPAIADDWEAHYYRVRLQ